MTGPDHDSRQFKRGKIPDSLATERGFLDAHAQFDIAFARFFGAGEHIPKSQGRRYHGSLRVPLMAERINIACGNENNFDREKSTLNVSVRYILGFDPNIYFYEETEVRNFPQFRYVVPNESILEMTDDRYALTMAEIRSHITPEEATWVDKLIEEAQKKYDPESKFKIIDDLLDAAPDTVPIQKYEIFATDMTYFNNGTKGRAERIEANGAYFEYQPRPTPYRSLFLETSTGERYEYKEWHDRPSEMSIAPNTLEQRDLLLEEGCIVNDEPFTLAEERIGQIPPPNTATLQRFTRVLIEAINSGIRQSR